ncbi:DUF4062 domain-containing protein [Herbaspirillum seropedicae]|uniref:DUF4062 domain-containing protein n=1 Tax=Herbaspirillum seropedicae TaxID=964 RepID=UPI003FCE9E2A
MEKSLNELAALQTDEPAPSVWMDDLRLDPEADDIADSQDILMAEVKRDGQSRWIKQDIHGHQREISSIETIYATTSASGHKPVIRIFLSSTFRDMQVERNHLVRTVFPRLKYLALRYGITLQEIDLRWGVTAEQVERGETVAICLQEIDRCRDFPPFFIGMMGERYGWVPQASALEALDRQLAQQGSQQTAEELRRRAHEQGMSVTEMEFRYGVLDLPEARRHALFYARSPALTALLAQHQPDGQACYYDPPLAGKQAALKDEIIGGGLMRINGYRSVLELGEDIERMLSAAILRLGRACNNVQTQYSAPMPDGFAFNEAMTNAAAADRISLPLREADLPWQEIFRWRHFNGPAPRTIYLGPAGSGKMTEVAAEAKRDFSSVTLHCRSGVVHDAADALAYLRRTLTGLGAMAPWTGMPEDGFLEAVQAVTARLAIIITDIDLLWDDEALWRLLKRIDNPNLAVLVTASDPLYREMAGNFKVVEVTGLEYQDRRQFISDYLQRYRKTLEPQLADRIATLPLAGSPAFLRLVLDELRRDATFETLSELIGTFAAMPSLRAAYAHVMQAWIQQVDKDGRDAAKWNKALTALAASPYAIAEDFFLSEQGAGLSRLAWATWIGLASPVLTEMAGGWQLSNALLGDVIRTHYMDGQDMTDILRQLTSFTDMSMLTYSSRRLSDYTGLLLRVAQQSQLQTDLQALHEWMQDPDASCGLAAHNPNLMMQGWRYLMQAGYSIDALLEHPDRLELASSGLLSLFCDLQAWPLLEKLARKILESGKPIPGLQSEAAAPEMYLAMAVWNQGDAQQACAIIAPSIEAWMAHHEATPPLTLGMLMGLATDGYTDPVQWGSALRAGVESVLSSERWTNRLHYTLMLTYATIYVAVLNEPALCYQLASQLIVRSDDLPVARAYTVRMLGLAEAVTALCQLGRYEEVITLACGEVDVSKRDTAPSEQHGRCARIMAAAYAELGRFDEALAALDYAWEFEATVTQNPAIPIVICALYAICLIWKRDHVRASAWLQQFQARMPECVQAAQAMMPGLQIALTSNSRFSDWKRLEAALAAMS